MFLFSSIVRLLFPMLSLDFFQAASKIPLKAFLASETDFEQSPFGPQSMSM
jgi:hypothetical protein